MSGRSGVPALGAVLLIALLGTAMGLALASAVLTLPVALGRRDAPVVVVVALSQALAWWWLRRRQRGLARAALRLVAEHKALALWAGADLALLVLLWAQGSATWARIGPVWGWVAAYAAARAALLALGVTVCLVRFPTPRGRVLAQRTARSARLALLGAALTAPVWMPLTGSPPAWQGAVLSGLLALLAVAAWSRAGAARETWVGLAGLLASPAVALGGSALLLGVAAQPLAAALALSALLPALGLATLATPAAILPLDRT